MKKLLPIAAAILLCVLAGCTHEKFEVVDFDDFATEYDGIDFHVISESDVDAEDVSLFDNNEYIKSYLAQESGGTKATYINMANFVAGLASTFTSKMLHQVVGTYTSVGVDGEPLVVSGKIVYPKNKKVKNLMIVSHWTIGSNAEAPSQSFSFEGIFAAKGYAVIIADYIGFGVTANMIHPYLQSEVTASNVLDLALVAKPFLEKRGIVPESDEVILLGYSQGGATTLHVQRLLESSIKYGGLFDIKKNYCGAGPYNIARTYDFAIRNDYTGISCAIPMIVQGISTGMPKPLEVSSFFKEPLKSHYKEWLNSKKYTVAQMSELIGSHYLTEIMSDEARDKSAPETARFYRELILNSIPTYYLPKAPIYMFHSEDDRTVPFENSQVMQRQFRYDCPDVEYNFGHYGNHQSGAIKFILTVLKMLD